VIRVGEPRELLAYVPFRLGHRPSDSLVAVCVRAGGGRVGLVARLDVADLAHPERGPELAAFVAERLRGDGAARVVLVLYTATPRAAIRRGEGAAAEALHRVRHAVGTDVADAVWVVGPAGYGELCCTDPACCPVGGRPVEELESTVVGAHMVLAGEAIAPDRRALRVRVTAARGARRSARRAAAAARAEHRRVSEAASPDTAEAIRRWAERLLECWREALLRAGTGRHLPAATLGRVLVALEVPAVRDALLASLAVPGVDSENPARAGGPPGSAGLSRRPPHAVLVHPARAVLEAVAAHAPRPRLPAALAALAFLAWWEGDGTRANVVLEQCLEAGPPVGLAWLLADVLARGVPPAWASRERDEPAS
jgi:hypothetical protein